MYIKVDVQTEFKTESITKTSNDSYSIRVKEKAERGLANRRIVELIRKEFGTNGVLVKIVSGHTSTKKILSVEIINNSK